MIRSKELVKERYPEFALIAEAWVRSVYEGRFPEPGSGPLRCQGAELHTILETVSAIAGDAATMFSMAVLDLARARSKVPETSQEERLRNVAQTAAAVLNNAVGFGLVLGVWLCQVGRATVSKPEA